MEHLEKYIYWKLTEIKYLKNKHLLYFSYIAKTTTLTEIKMKTENVQININY